MRYKYSYQSQAFQRSGSGSILMNFHQINDFGANIASAALTPCHMKRFNVCVLSGFYSHSTVLTLELNVSSELWCDTM